MNILVSACLLGTPCRYDGASKRYPQVIALRDKGHFLVPVCPEVLGGLPTPRSPAERTREGSVKSKAGLDVTASYEKGAQDALALARRYDCTLAILKERSPSCGCGMIYDGSFTRTLVSGNGVTAQLLMEHGIPVIGESAVEAYLNALEDKNHDSL